MKSITIKIPESLDSSLRLKAKKSGQPVSELVRRAVVREMESESDDFARLAAPYRGIFSGPADLSTREGYGSQESH